MNCPAKFPCSAASLHCPFRVARVSRLIGNSHITVNSSGWQVNPAPLRPRGSHRDAVPIRNPTSSKRKKRHSKKSGVSLALRLSLASQKVCGPRFLPPYLLSPSRPVCLYSRTAALAVALAGWLLFFGLVRVPPAPVHHWHFLYSNRSASSTNLSFQWLTGNMSGQLSPILEVKCAVSPKNHKM